MNKHSARMLLATTFAALAAPVQAQGPAEIETLLARCSALGDPGPRLACYDALAKKGPLASTPQSPAAAPPAISEANAASSATQGGAATAGAMAQVPPAQAAAEAAAAPNAMAAVQNAQPDQEVSRMVQRWEADTPSKRGVFAFRPHRDTYLLLANYSNSTNDAPFRNTTPAGLDAQRVELSYQLSFKMKLMEGVAKSPLDLWFAYTQQSFWQAYNRSASSPFRETNYQPELMVVAPLTASLGPVRLRYANLGLVHQSNGQTAGLSRSWNRLYVETGAEVGHLGATLRLWKRLDNAKSDNDNIDISSFMGHGDLRVTYRNAGHEYALMLRRNFHTRHGAIQASWAFPLRDNLKGYVQGFSGYGQSLIDYNYAQMSVGAGVLVDF